MDPGLVTRDCPESIFTLKKNLSNNCQSIIDASDAGKATVARWNSCRGVYPLGRDDAAALWTLKGSTFYRVGGHNFPLELIPSPLTADVKIFAHWP
jgi:hypothetical protein